MNGFPLVSRHLDDFRALPPRRRRLVFLIAVFIVYHVTATLVWGAGERVREVARPFFFHYSAVLKATQSWGMFATIDKEENLFVDGVTRRGETIRLSPPEEEFTWKGLVLRRERKYISHLVKSGPRAQYGERFLVSFCAEDTSLDRVNLWSRTGRPSNLGPPERLLSVRCASSRGGRR